MVAPAKYSYSDRSSINLSAGSISLTDEMGTSVVDSKRSLVRHEIIRLVLNLVFFREKGKRAPS